MHSQLNNNLMENTTQSPEEIKIAYMNAIKTYYGAHGHTKAERNKRIADYYKDKLIALGISIPSNDECFAKGVFNGNANN